MPLVADQNTSLFRFIVLAILIIIFITVAVDRIWQLRIAAERISVTHILGSLRSALGIRLSEIVVKEGSAGLGKLHHSNPMELLSTQSVNDAPHGIVNAIQPVNYSGAYTPQEAPREPGIWYFDTQSHTLFYRLHFADYVENNKAEDSGLLGFKLKLDFVDHNNNNVFEPPSETLRSANIVSLHPYQWKESLEP